MPYEMKYDTYPFIAPERYVGSLKGKVVIVTGTSAGIGRSIAKAVANAGGTVACIARRKAQLTTLVEEIKASGGKAVAIVADVAKKGGAQELVSQVEAELGPVDILINNAGISRIGPLEAEPEDLDVWWRVYEVNVKAPVSLIRAVLPGMIARKSGIVLTVSSGVAHMQLPVMTAYASSKTAISKFHELLVPELDGTGVYSFAVCPGQVRTELGSPEDAINKAGIQHPATQKFIASVTAPGIKMGEPELPADTIVAIVADERYRVLHGKHVSATQDLEPVLQEAEKPDMGRIGSEKLQIVNISMV